MREGIKGIGVTMVTIGAKCEVVWISCFFFVGLFVVIL